MAFEFGRFFSRQKNYDKRHSNYIYDLVKNIIAPGNRAFISPLIQKIIDQVLDENLPPDWRTNEKFRSNLINDFQTYRFDNYDNDYFSEYYAAYYIPNNFYKIQLMFLELFKLNEFDLNKSSIRILDIGSSIGTTSLALYDIYTLFENVLSLYGYKDFILPKLEIDSVEISANNIKVFKQLRDKLTASNSIKINDPINLDITSQEASNVKLKKYDIIFISNMLCELEDDSRDKLINRISEEIKKSTIVILIDTANFYDTKMVKQIQYSISQNQNLSIISPCGKINYSCLRCNNCYSSRSESLLIPNTMSLLTKKHDERDDNEKLKWSYLIFKKENRNKIADRNTKDDLMELNRINQSFLEEYINIRVEVISNKYYEKSNQDHYFLKICDQSEENENTILKIPEYFFLPYYSFGDIFSIKNVKVVELNAVAKAKFRANYALEINSEFSEIINESTLPEPIGNIKFNDVEEENLTFFMNRIFGFNKFNDGQFEILRRILENEDILGILATGGGKSLTFQLPALLKPGVSVVVSPLKSLMDDQVHNLKNRFGLDFVDTIHSGITITEKKKVLERFRKGYLKILYISPERLQQKSFQKELTNLISKGININYFPIDEAHCISEWGHDFRPAYARLKERQLDLPHVDGTVPSIIALTATASAKVREDVLDQLVLDREKNLLHKIVDRKELSLEVIKLQYDVANNCYLISYRDGTKNTNNFIQHKFEHYENRPQILKYILENILPLRFDNFNIAEFPGLIFTMYAEPKNPERANEGARGIARNLRIQGIRIKPWFSELRWRKNLTKKQTKFFNEAWEKIKYNTQMDYVNGKINLLATTKGFGMGIDKPDIRYVIHYGFPGSMEAYFQQIGRAGRDRNHSHCILMWDAPTNECENKLKRKFDDKQFPIPECYKLDTKTSKLKFESCTYERPMICDFAKQIFFIEGNYPTITEVIKAIDYLVEKSNDEKSSPWVYIRLKYLVEAVGKKLGYSEDQIKDMNESQMVETLYTLKIIEDYSKTYLKVGVERNKTWKEILESTNNEIIHEHIKYFVKVFGDNFLFSQPSNSKSFFDISEYIMNLRENHGIDILIEEVVQFFNLVDERNDVNVSFNYMNDFGYEIKLASQEIITKTLQSNKIKKIDEWKISQYGMLQNLMDYCELKPLDNRDDGTCRRANILTVFGTESADMSGEIKCDFCDNCGFVNDWHIQANNIIAGTEEQDFVKDLRSMFAKTSKNKLWLINNHELIFKVLQKLKDNDYYNVTETVANTWNEQIGESDNPFSNFVLSIIYYHNNNLDSYFVRLQVFIETYLDNKGFISKVIVLLNKLFNIEIYDLYLNHFYPKSVEDHINALDIFDSSKENLLSKVEQEIAVSLMKERLNQLYYSVNNFKEISFNE